MDHESTCSKESLSTAEALTRLHQDIESVLQEHQLCLKKRFSKIWHKEWLRDALHHESRYTTFCWTSAGAILACSFALFFAYIVDKSDRLCCLLSQGILLLLLLGINVYLVLRENNLRHSEMSTRIHEILHQLKDASETCHWNPENYPHLCSPVSPCITLQWTYRDGKLVNLPWALLVRDDIVVIRPGQQAPGRCSPLNDSDAPELDAHQFYSPHNDRDPPPSTPIARNPLPNKYYIMRETPYLRNLKLVLDRALDRPVTRFNQYRYLLTISFYERRLLPAILGCTLAVSCLRYVYLHPWAGAGPWPEMFLTQLVSVSLPFLPLVFPAAWLLLTCIGTARIHAILHANIKQMCDYGQFKYLVIPPTSVVLTTRQHKLSRKLCLQSVAEPEWNDWTPLIVLANRKSGNNDGGMVLSLFRRLLNPAQVIDLAEHSPEAALEWCCFLNKKRISTRLLVAGGDGTIGWVLNAVEKKNLMNMPALAIVPLGTGNDLSRVLGWGKEQPVPLDPSAVLDKVQKAEIAKLDRWKVEIKPARHLGIRLPAHRIYMYNYFSVGVDAQIALDFHRTRESPYYLFASRIFNKMLYLGFGTQQVVGRDCQDLNKRVELYLDGIKADLPSIESVVVMNIPSWGAGVQLWSMGTADETVPSQSISDGKLEVVGIYSSFHIAQLQVGLSQPYRFGQASHVKITLKSPAPIQVDGEPWLQKTSEINIHFHNQATVLQLNETG